MSSVRSGCAIASLVLVGCGSSLGSVQGHDVSASHAAFLSSGTSNTLVLVTGDMGNICEVFTGKARPVGCFTVLETILANWNGTSTDPAVPGIYVQSSASRAAGLVSETLLQWGSGCVAYSTTQPGSGSVRIESFGGFQTGAHLVADFDLKFGDDHVAGRVDATYCGALQHACGP
ncbi:MAG TPA: hypothetical protein VLQ79_08815 [Myxococcaceae bacterium]|nr:hypothetical protein [Myxococcaceae bacterium]